MNGTGDANTGDFDTTGTTSFNYDNWAPTSASWLPNDGSATPTSWNYIVTTVTVTGEDQWIQIFYEFAGEGGLEFPGPAAFQIVNSAPIPDPASLALVGLGGLCLLSRRRRRA